MTVLSSPRRLVRPQGFGRGATVVLLLVVALIVGALLSGSVSVSLARLSDTDTAGGAFDTDVLSPPTGPAASGGASVTLTWTATSKTWAAGYTIWRAAASAGPYSQIDTVTPRTTETYTDSPSAGTYYYQVRAFYQNWESVDAGPVSATVGSPPTSTGLQDCVVGSDAADTLLAGDNNGYQTNPTRACALDGLFARDASSGTGGTESCGIVAVPDVRKDRHRWWGYAFGLPGTVTSIDGIEVQARLRLNSNGGTTRLCTQLSWDGGTSWTPIQSLDVSGGSTWTTYSFGGTGDTWGRTWAVGELDASTFRVRVIDASTQTTKNFLLDALRVEVTYTP